MFEGEFKNFSEPVNLDEEKDSAGSLEEELVEVESDGKVIEREINADKETLERLEFLVVRTKEGIDYEDFSGDEIPASHLVEPKLFSYEEIKDLLPDDLSIEATLVKINKGEKDLYRTKGVWNYGGEKIFISGRSNYIPDSFFKSGVWIAGIFDKDSEYKKAYVDQFKDSLKRRQEGEGKGIIDGYSLNRNSIALHPELLKKEEKDYEIGKKDPFDDEEREEIGDLR